MANNLPLAVAIADAASMSSGRAQNVGAAARNLDACHPESDATVSDISAAILDQRTGRLPRMHKSGRSIWWLD
jgi:hypothetical protein